MLWLGARCGIAGAGSGAGADAVAGLVEKKSLVVGSSENGVKGVIGERSLEEELSALKKPLSILLKSLSEATEAADELDEDDSAEALRMSGAFNAWTLVVLMSSVGSEILVRSMVPGV